MHKGKKLETIVCDIDGTISDRRHRLKHLEGKKDWDAFFEEMHKDPHCVAFTDGSTYI